MENIENSGFLASLKKWVFRFIGVVNVFLAAGLTYLFLSRGIAHPSDGWNWTDFITILLGVLTIVLAALGTLIAVAALWGYQQIQKGAEARSVRSLNGYLRSKEFEGQLGKLVEEWFEKNGAQKAVEEGIVILPSTVSAKVENEWDDNNVD